MMPNDPLLAFKLDVSNAQYKIRMATDKLERAKLKHVTREMRERCLKDLEEVHGALDQIANKLILTEGQTDD